MPFFNQQIIMGNLGKDPEVRYLPDSTPVANLSIAYKEYWWDKQGQQQESTTWFSATAYGDNALNIAKMLKKGDCIQVIGKSRIQQYQDKKTHEQRTALDIQIQTWQAIRYKPTHSQSYANDAENSVHDFM
jgi:single-strand DNA-binding protein